MSVSYIGLKILNTFSLSDYDESQLDEIFVASREGQCDVRRGFGRVSSTSTLQISLEPEGPR